MLTDKTRRILKYGKDIFYGCRNKSLFRTGFFQIRNESKINQRTGQHVLTPEQRKKNMQHIKSNDTKIEVILRKALWARGYRYRKNYKELPGKPDIVLTKYKIAVFCDGEFFHGKDWEVLKPRLEKSNNSDFWISKISRNRERDDEINKELLFLGWTVIRFWGNEIKKDTDACIRVIEETIFDEKMRACEEHD